MKCFFKKMLVAVLFLTSGSGFSVNYYNNSNNDDWVSCTMGCKNFYITCKQMTEVLGFEDRDCEKIMTDCNKMCEDIYNPTY